MKNPAILGGTFDPLHDGHKALFEKAFDVSDFVLIGLTSDRLASEYRTRKITPYSIRKRRLRQYLNRAFGGKKFVIEEMDEIFNLPIIQEIKEGFLIVSEGKNKVAKEINKVREKNGSKEFDIVVVPYVLALDGLPIKATRIVEGEINKHGKLMHPPVIAVGSKNKLKVEAATVAFIKIFGNVVVSGVDVDSGVDPQPIDDKTILGAKNRAVAAMENCPSKFKPVFGVGIEAGLFWIPAIKDYMDVQFCTVVDKIGKITYGHSPGFVYPPSFFEKIRSGEEIETIIEDFFGIKNIGEKEGAIGYLTQNRVTRKDLIISAVLMAMVPRIKSRLYQEII